MSASRKNHGRAAALPAGLAALSLVLILALVAPVPAGAQQLPAPRPDEIGQIQEMLNRLGYVAGAPDGRLGPQTRNAIAAFETNEGLPASGSAVDAFVLIAELRRALDWQSRRTRIISVEEIPVRYATVRINRVIYSDEPDREELWVDDRRIHLGTWTRLIDPVTTFELPDEDIVVVGASDGGNLCPAGYHLLVVRPQGSFLLYGDYPGCRAGAEFRRDGDAVVMEFRSLGPVFPAETWRYDGVRLVRVEAPRPAAPAPNPELEAAGTWVGRSSADRIGGVGFYEIPALQRILVELVGPEVHAELVNTDAPPNPVEQVGGLVVTSACEAGSCGLHNWATVVDPGTGRVHVCLFTDDRNHRWPAYYRIWFSNALPEPIRTHVPVPDMTPSGPVNDTDRCGPRSADDILAELRRLGL